MGQRAQRWACALAIAGAGLHAPVGTAASSVVLEGVALAPYVQTEERVLELAVCGVRDTLWIDHYVTAVYVPRDGSVHAVPDAASPKAVRLHVLDARYLPPDIPDKWRGALERELSGRQMASVRAAYRNLADGDVVMIVYTPRRGIVMSVNGRLIVEARGHGVINAIIKAWAEGDSVADKLTNLTQRFPCTSR